MDLSDLKILVAVVENGGVTGAARQLRRVPSGVTTRLLQLEKALGTDLFLREKKRLVVTSKGRLLYEHAQRILAMVSEAEMQIKDTEAVGRFRIGAMESTAAARLPKPLARLHRLHPRLQLELTTGTSRFLYERLCDNQLDVVFVADIGADEAIERVGVFDEELVLVAPAGQARVKTPHDIASATILVFTDGCSYRSRLLGWFRAHDLEPGRIVELASYHAIMGGAAAGMGIGIVPVSVLDLFSDKRTLSVHRLARSSAKCVTELIWRRGLASASISALRECIAAISK